MRKIFKNKIINSLLIYSCLNFFIPLDVLSQIESSGNSLAYNDKTLARGLYQITPIVLKEWNNKNKIKHTTKDLYCPKINEKIAKWYLKRIIFHYLPRYKIPATEENILISYNWGIKNIILYKKGIKRLPKETRNYLIRYNKAKKKK